ncbi:MAG: hypothetical protein ABJA57_04870 [Ginsengibacter sp.]
MKKNWMVNRFKLFAGAAALLFSIFVCQYLPAQKVSQRYEIDAKRMGVAYYDKDALPRSREFIRLDSTYYVGYFYEGMYKYQRAADYAGYRNCIQPLQHALSLFENDYKNDLKSIIDAGQVTIKSDDIRQICLSLYESYSNIEQADSAMWVLDKVHNWGLATDFMEYHIKAAWTIHRNRYYLHKFWFLKNSVDENEQLALQHLYQALAEGNMTATFYLAIIHNYLQNLDSAEFYYNFLMRNGGLSFNNYAHYKNTLGEFGEAIEDFNKDKFAFDKRLIESYYFLPTLYINSGNTLQAIDETNDIIRRNGSTPGFGWYNIALARSYLYNGQLDSSEKAIDKASLFKELHLGTTLGQAQYDFAINVIRLLLAEREIARIKFENPGWWYSVSDIASISGLTGETFLLRYAIVNQFVNNPERQEVIYSLFSSENVIGFDEIYNLVKVISPAYFTRLYRQKMQDEKRQNVKRYMQLFYGNLLYQDGDKTESTKVLEDIMNNTLLDTAHEKLFLGRLYQQLAINYYEGGNKMEGDKMMFYCFSEYPQLVPFSSLKMKMKLNVSGLSDKVTVKIISDLENCNIRWESDLDFSTANAFVSFTTKSKGYEATYSVFTSTGELLIPSKRIIFRNSKGIGTEIALRLFGVNGPLDVEQADPN